MTGENFAATGQLLGTVVAVQANFYRVQMDEEDGEQRSREAEEKLNLNVPPPPLPPLDPIRFPPLLLCTRRTRLKKNRTTGDGRRSRCGRRARLGWGTGCDR